MKRTSKPPVPDQRLCHNLLSEQFRVSPLDKNMMMSSLLHYLSLYRAGLWAVSLEPSGILEQPQEVEIPPSVPPEAGPEGRIPEAGRDGNDSYSSLIKRLY